MREKGQGDSEEDSKGKAQVTVIQKALRGTVQREEKGVSENWTWRVTWCGKLYWKFQWKIWGELAISAKKTKQMEKKIKENIDLRKKKADLEQIDQLWIIYNVNTEFWFNDSYHHIERGWYHKKLKFLFKILESK